MPHQNHQLALGLLTMRFAQLEGTFKFLLWSLIQPKDQRLGQIITAPLSFRLILDIIDGVFRHRVSDADKQDKFYELLRRADAIEQQRNTFIHSEWGAGQTPDSLTRMKSNLKRGKGIGFAFEQINAQDVDSVSAKIEALTIDLFDFVDQLPAEIIGRVDVTI